MAAAGTHGLQGAPPDYSTASDPQTLLWDIFTGLGIMAFAYGNTVLPGACDMFNTVPANPVAHRCVWHVQHSACKPCCPPAWVQRPATLHSCLLQWLLRLICCGRDNVLGMLCSTAGHLPAFHVTDSPRALMPDMHH